MTTNISSAVTKTVDIDTNPFTNVYGKVAMQFGIGGIEAMGGTRIRSEYGEMPIEDHIGDRVFTRSGELKAIRWIGRRHHAKHNTVANPAVLPVRIARELARFCALRVEEGELLEAVRRQIAARAAAASRQVIAPGDECAGTEL